MSLHHGCHYSGAWRDLVEKRHRTLPDGVKFCAERSSFSHHRRLHLAAVVPVKSHPLHRDLRLPDWLAVAFHSFGLSSFPSSAACLPHVSATQSSTSLSSKHQDGSTRRDFRFPYTRWPNSSGPFPYSFRRLISTDWVVERDIKCKYDVDLMVFVRGANVCLLQKDQSSPPVTAPAPTLQTKNRDAIVSEEAHSICSIMMVD